MIIYLKPKKETNKMKPMISKYDVTISPDSDPLVQRTIEVDAIDMETACDYVRRVFRHSITVVSIVAHRERKQKAKNNFITVMLAKCTKLV